MIRRITFSPLTATGMTYTALGGMRFYSGDDMYDIGNIVVSNTTKLETTKLIATVGNSYSTTTYALLNMLDNKLNQKGDTGTFWLSSLDNMTIDITFKDYEVFDRVEFLTKPSASNDRGIDYSFYVRTYTGENADVLVGEDTVIPTNVNFAIQQVELQPISLFFTNGKENDKFKISKSEIILSDLKMTSNTTPTPYVAKASTEYSTTYQAFKAFNGDTTASSAWITKSGIKDGWLQIDYGSKKRVNSFYITSRNSAEFSAPNAYRIVGSDDEINWVTLKEVRNQVSWAQNTTRFFYFNKVAYFRFYRLEIIEPASTDNGGTVTNYVAIGALDFTFDKTGITELPDTEEDTITKYGGALTSISQPISSYNYVLNDKTTTKLENYWTKDLKNKPLFISVERGK